MEKKEVAFSVQMTEKKLYRFTMYHAYHSMSGIIGLFLSAAAIVLLVTQYNNMADQTKLACGIVAVWFTVLDPVIFRFRAKGQIKKNKAYQSPLQYQICDAGIRVSQNGEEQTVEWERIYKIVETGTQYLVYSSRIHAFVFPKTALGEEQEQAARLMLEYTAGKGVKLNHRLRTRKMQEDLS